MQSTSQNKAVRIDTHGGIEQLAIVHSPVPEPKPGELLIRTVASSINPVDWKTRAWNRGPQLPMILGWDLAGIVVMSTVADYAAGDRVVAMSAQIATGVGTWRELVALPARLVAPAPRSVSLAEAATLPLAGLTAQQSLAAMNLPASARLLVIGAAGAVGALVTQLAVAAGMKVDAIVSRPEHVAAAADLGACTVATDVTEVPSGAYDAVFDAAGIDPGPVLREHGMYLGISDEPLPPIPGARGIGVQEDGPGLARLCDLVDSANLRLRIARRFPLRDVRAAHRAFESGGLLGKVVLEF